MSDEADPNLDSLIDQLKDNTTVNNHVRQNYEELCDDSSPEQLESFVIKNSSKLVSKSLTAIDEIKDFITASGDPDSISSLSELIRASSGALESLNKIVVQNKRSQTTLTVKQMDVQAKYSIEEKKNDNALLGTRDEIFKKILDEAKVIDIKDNTEVTLDSEDQKNPPSK
ncbi:hypothetical protein CL622_07510 [archaeon]|jgi:hypothetical protein|nr:hypothetical protein [archaeon]